MFSQENRNKRMSLKQGCPGDVLKQCQPGFLAHAFAEFALEMILHFVHSFAFELC